MIQRPKKDSVLWFEKALVPTGWADSVRVFVAEGRIDAVAIDVPAQPDDEKHRVGIPAASNVHSHAFQRGIAGLTEHRRGSDNFWSWRDVMYGFVEKMNAEQLEAIAALAYMEMLESGVTRVGEFHYFHHAVDGRHHSNIAEHAERLASAASEAGIGLTLLPVFYAHGGVGGAPPKPTQRRFINSLDSFGRLLEGCRNAVANLAVGSVGIAAHSLRAVTAEELQALISLANGAPLHIHIAEQLDEVTQWQSWAGCRPVEWLLDHADVNDRWCLVHATHLSPVELQRLAASAATVGLCPITEANLGDGIFPAVEFLKRGGAIGIGTDSNIQIDYPGELRTLEYGQRLIHRERNALHGGDACSTGRNLFERSLRGGAVALDQRTGQIAPGFIADVVALTTDLPSMLRRSGDAVLDSWIFTGAHAVDCVWSAGRKVVCAGRHPDRERIVARYAAALTTLLG